MLDQTEAALKVFSLLVRRGVQQIAFGDCGEGLAWARGLIADCHYRMAHCYAALHRPKMAIKFLNSHIGLRGPGCRSIYSLAKVREELGKYMGLAGSVSNERVAPIRSLSTRRRFRSPTPWTAP